MSKNSRSLNLEAQARASEAGRRAQVAAAATEHRNHPLRIARRINRFEADVRKMERTINRARTIIDIGKSRIPHTRGRHVMPSDSQAQEAFRS